MSRTLSPGTAPGFSLLCLVSSIATAAPLVAAETDRESPAPQAVGAVYDAFGLASDSGEIVGAGGDYKVFFRRGGVEFHPALGSAAPRNLPVRLAFESVVRGDGAIAAASPMPEIAGATSVVYRHGPSIVERYDVRGDGVEQSFVLETLPVGGGDLVLRLRLESELAAIPTLGGSELRFAAAGIGGVTIGAVSGIDADGRRCAGSLRLSGDVIELALPAEFVDSARLPLVVDPLISTAGVVAAGDVRRPDVAFDQLTSRWLVTWDTTFSATDVDVRAHLLDSPGSLYGSLYLGESATTSYAFRPVVANVRMSGNFLIAWQEGGPEQSPPSTPMLRGRVLNPSTPILTTTATFWGNASAPELAGDSTMVDDDAVMVFQNHIASDLRAAIVRVPATGMPVLHTSIFLPTTTADTEPTISKHGGSSRRYAVAWTHRYSATDRDIEAVLISPLTGVIGSKVTLGASTKDEDRPRCDGNGVNFAFAWQQRQAPGDRDIVMRRATWHDDLVSYSTEIPLAPGVGVDEVEVDLAYCGPKYIVAWSEQVSGEDYDVYMTGVEPTTLVQAEPVVPVGIGDELGERGVAVISKLDAGADADTAMLTWHALGFGVYLPFIDIQLAEAVGGGGPVVDLGGGCGAGGTAAVNGPVAVGNYDFKVVLYNASAVATTSVFNLSLPGATFTCGACVWNPYFLTFSIPMSAGITSVALPIPVDMALGGLVFDAQWSVLQSGVTPCMLGPGLSLSNRLRMTMGF